MKKTGTSWWDLHPPPAEHPDIARQAAERQGRMGSVKGAGEHGGLVIAVVLAGWWARRRVRHSL